jgi:beta-barrel assembly-enhancing protease
MMFIKQFLSMTIRLLRQCRHLLLLMMSMLLMLQTTSNAADQDSSLNLNQAGTLTGIPYEKPDVLNLGVDANLPELGDASQMALSPLDEMRIADQIMRQVSTSSEVVQDAEVVDYIQALGNRLARSGPDKHQSFNFFVVTDPTINAFAMPGGVIGVHTGLILAANSESELASVLGHEIGHVTQHHLARMIESQKNATFKNLAGIALAILVARSNPQLAQGALTTSSALGIQNQLDYTRAHEREADRVGIQILKNAGFDVRGMPAFFATLQRANRFAEGTAPSFLRTHPLTSERISDVQNRVDQIPYRQSLDSLEFQYVRAKLRALGSFFDRAKTQSAIDVFHKNITQERYANASVDHYGLAVGSLSNRDFNLAEREINWLKENAPTHPMIENLIANYYVESQQLALAVKQYETALAKYPTARALIYGYTELLLAMRQYDNALNLIDQKQVIYTNDAYLYELKARVYTIQNKALLSHQAQGEAYFRLYDLKRAIEQMDLAVKSNDGDFYQHSIVEARLKALKRLQVDDEKG